MKRDMTFYKYSDIYMLINEMSDEDQDKLILAARDNGLEKELAYCINSVNGFFELPECKLLEYVTKRQNDDLNYVIAPTEKKLYCYCDNDVVKRFFAKDRMKLLLEVVS